ncbi:MAG: phosphatase PAP2 family protein [Acidimicrobiales bacterium]
MSRLSPAGRRGAAAIALLMAGVLSSCGGPEGETRPVVAQAAPAEARAGRWQTWVVTAPSVIAVPPPPPADSAQAEADLAEVERMVADTSPEAAALVERYSGPMPTKPWSDTAFDFVAKTAKNPPISSRNYALVHAAMYDAMVSTWYWKYQYNLAPPAIASPRVAVSSDPSYPSEHAAMAGAASVLLAHLYPAQAAGRLEEMAEAAGRSRLHAGANTPSDVAAGLELGRAVAERFITFARGDGSDRRWDGKRPAGIGTGPAFWEPPPGAASPPTEPLAGTWRPWVMTSGSQFRPGPPPAYGSDEFRAEAQEVLDATRNITPEQRRAADLYAGLEGSSLPAGVVLDIIQSDLARAATTASASRPPLSLPRAVRAMALVSVALADAGISAWDAKFTYWNPRPENAIRDLGLDSDFEPVIATPRFPAYVSGSATYAGAAQVVMTYLFPDQTDTFEERAETQAESRIWGGIHYRADQVGLAMGRQVGELVVAWAKTDGADVDTR